MRLINGFEGGTDEVDVSTANSGGTSGDAFDTVTIGSATTLKYDTAQQMYGTTALRVATGITSATVHAGWTTSLGAISIRIFGRLYFRPESLDANGRTLGRIRSGGTQVARFGIDGSFFANMRNSANTVVDSGSVAFTAGVWYRVEWDISSGGSATNTVRVFRGDSTTLLDQISATSAFATGNIDEVNIGQVVAATNIPNGWFDSIEVNDYGYPGPVRRLGASLGAG